MATAARAGRWDEARGAFAALALEVPNNLTVQGYLGVIAARRGDLAEAERVATWLRDLDRPYLWGRHTLWRARIAAVLGQRQQAVDLLRDAFAQGVPHAVSHHADIDLQPLRDYPPFRQLMRPKGGRIGGRAHTCDRRNLRTTYHSPLFTRSDIEFRPLASAHGRTGRKCG